MMFVLGGRGWDCETREEGTWVVIFACGAVRSFSSRVSRGLGGAERGKQVDVSWAIFVGVVVAKLVFM